MTPAECMYFNPRYAKLDQHIGQRQETAYHQLIHEELGKFVFQRFRSEETAEIGPQQLGHQISGMKLAR